MSAMLRFRCLSLLVLVAGAASSARAELIIGNLSQSPGSNNALFDAAGKAISFVMGSQSYTLDSLVLRLNYNLGEPVVEIRNDVGGSSPGGTVVASFTNPIAGVGFQNYTFTPNSPTTLAANTKYWLNVYGTGAGPSFPSYWAQTNSFTITENAATYQDLQTWSGGNNWSSSTKLNLFELNGTLAAVPEPTSFLLVAGLAAAGGLRRRFRRHE